MLGIIGGIGPESTVDYYQRIIAAWRERRNDGSYPPLLINSINLQQMVTWFEADDLASVTAHVIRELNRLARGGAEFGLMAANTPHIVFDDIARGSPIPLVSIVEATCREAQRLGLKKLGLLGTRFTMQGRFYPEVFARSGLSIAVPQPAEQPIVHDRYMNELVKGVFKPETRAKLLEMVSRLRQREGIEGVILGGTELPLILRDVSHEGMPFLDTTGIHVRAAVDHMLS
jgi:aspartate racemase